MTNGTSALAAGALSKELTTANVIQQLLANRGGTQNINKEFLEAIKELSWKSDDFLWELFSNTSTKKEPDGKGGFKLTPTSEGILSGYDNGTSFAEVGQYFLGVPIAFLATAFAQEAYMQDITGGMAFQAELKQLSKTIEDYTNMMLALQLAAPESENVTIDKLTEKLEEYKAVTDKLKAGIESLSEKNDSLSETLKHRNVFYDGLYKVMPKGPKATHEYLVNTMLGYQPYATSYSSTSAPASTA